MEDGCAYQVAAEEDEDVCVREDGEEAVVDGGIGDDLAFEAVLALVALSAYRGVPNGDGRGCVPRSGVVRLWIYRRSSPHLSR